MESMSKKNIIETVDTAKDYACKLEDLLSSVKGANDQIQTSTQKTISEIDSTFDLLVSTLLESLNKRRALLRTEALRLRDDGLAPLKACRDIIDEKLRATKLYIEEGRNILRVGGLTTSLEKTLCFTEQASLLGSLPAVPNLEEVADLSFQCPVESIVPELQQCVANIGQVSRMGPVQITEVHEKPGALLVQWEEVDYERVVDVHSFRLQLAYGDVRGQDHLQLSNYHDAYVGPEGQHLVRDLRPGVPYTFRVCCRVEGSSDWSWGESNSNYLITNEKKLASKTSPEQSVLLSRTAQFGPGHSIEFTVLECGIGCSDEGLGLVAGPVEGENLIQPGCLFVNTQAVYSVLVAKENSSFYWLVWQPLYLTFSRTNENSHYTRRGSSGGYLTLWFLGQSQEDMTSSEHNSTLTLTLSNTLSKGLKAPSTLTHTLSEHSITCVHVCAPGSVFVDGAEKTTKLPSLQKCSKVCFTCENIRDGKIRVNVDSDNKTVTYDWSVRCPLYFAVCFGEMGWKVMVE
uniref:Fibronectin type-III domain-containing protein n=1 Tax=Timema cristinae TaxID=61476 RepID=A0A7R9DE28_TIMCR|nr:unnamed protein product [Timema cristinae]